ncbi:MAG: hypothetical protein AVDCRST_MAG40-1882, partial [uncultured Gemmatimonadaceae bacterium]
GRRRSRARRRPRGQRPYGGSGAGAGPRGRRRNGRGACGRAGGGRTGGAAAAPNPAWRALTPGGRWPRAGTRTTSMRTGACTYWTAVR